MKEPTGQLQHRDLGEAKSNIPLDDDSTDAISEERVQEGHTSEDVQIDKETGKEIDKAGPTLKLLTAKTSQDFEADGWKETVEQGFQQEHDKSKKDIISIQQEGFRLTTQSGLSSDNCLNKELSQNQNLEIGKKVVGIDITSEKPVTTTSSDSQVYSMKETMGQSFEEHDATAEATMASQSIDLEQTQSSKSGKEDGGILVASQSSSTSKDSETVEQTGHARVQQEDQELKNASKPNLPSVQIATATSPSTMSEILEIFHLVQLKDGEAALLAQALKQYPQLLLPREQRTQRRMAFSYRVLVDILVMLATKSHCTITRSEKSTLDDNLCEATSLGLNRDWVDLVRARVFDFDMSDVLSAQERIRDMEAKLKTCDMNLKQVQKEKEEARRYLEMAQSQFDAIDYKCLCLLEDRKTLMANKIKLRDVISAMDTPFGI